MNKILIYTICSSILISCNNEHNEHEIQKSSLLKEAQKHTFPEDVASFIKRRDSCDHFRGEPPYDKEREAFLLKMMEKTCKGTDRELLNLLEKYKEDQSIINKLNEYENNIEYKTENGSL